VNGLVDERALAVNGPVSQLADDEILCPFRTRGIELLLIEEIRHGLSGP
jgi:hypothetical protein